MGHINGLKGASATFESTSQGSSLAGRVVFVRHKDRTFQLLGYTARDRWSSYSSVIEGSLRSFAPLSDPEILKIGPARLDIIELDRAMTVEEFNARYPSSIPLEQVALLNQVELGGQFSKGQLVKRVVGGPKEKKGKKKKRYPGTPRRPLLIGSARMACPNTQICLLDFLCFDDRHLEEVAEQLEKTRYRCKRSYHRQILRDPRSSVSSAGIAGSARDSDGHKGQCSACQTDGGDRDR